MKIEWYLDREFPYKAFEEKIMLRSTLWKKIKELENQGLSVRACGYLKSKKGKIYVGGPIPKEATGIPSSSRPRFYVSDDEKFIIDVIGNYTYFLDVKISVEGKTEFEAGENLQKICEKYKF